jgi:NAD+ kinase
MKTIGILHHPKVPATRTFAHDLRTRLEQAGVQCWLASAWDEADAKAHIAQTDALITLGGDGTILRAARIGVEKGVPIAGINFGRVGFLAEYQPSEAQQCLNDLLTGRFWIEERMMLHAELLRGEQVLGRYDALNDVVIGRGTVARVVRLRLAVDGQEPLHHVADGIVVATPTGSTAYTVAAGGPIADPRVRAMIVTPIAPHLSLLRSIIVPDASTVDIFVESDYPALVSMDGQIELTIQSHDLVRVQTSERISRFIRTRPKEYFYVSLAQRLA